MTALACQLCVFGFRSIRWSIFLALTFTVGCVFSPIATAATARISLSNDMVLEQMTVGRTNVNYAQSLVSCPAGWVRSACSGGVSGTSERDSHAIPIGSDSCQFSGNTSRNGSI